jgi:phenylalanyl-tRNA synthetase alpha subunit
VGIRDFIHCLEEHQNRLKRSLSAKEREETLREAETMVGMADAAIRELESVLGNRRVNLPEEHAVRFAQDVFLYLRDQEQKVKDVLRELASRDAAGG